MTIDVKTEKLVEMDAAPRHVPTRNGRPIHKSTIYRWTFRGVRGVKLETVLVGGRAFTSVEAIGRFLDRLNAGRAGNSGIPLHRSPARREREAAAAGARLAKAGY